MANARAASGNPGKAAPSALEVTSSKPDNTDTGLELEAALPPVAPPSSFAPADPIPQVEPGSALTPAPESAAEHLAGSSPAEVSELDAKFARLLEEVHRRSEEHTSE